MIKLLASLMMVLTLFVVSESEKNYLDGMKAYHQRRLKLAESAFLRASEKTSDFRVASLFKLAEIYQDLNQEKKYLVTMFRLCEKNIDPAFRSQAVITMARYFKDRGQNQVASRFYALYLTLDNLEARKEASSWLQLNGGNQSFSVVGQTEIPKGEELKVLLEQREIVAALEKDYAGADLTLYETILDLRDTSAQDTRKKTILFLERYPKSSLYYRVYLLLADLEEEMKNYGECLNLYRVALARSDFSSFHQVINQRMGSIYLTLRQPDRAYACFAKGEYFLAAAIAARDAGKTILACEYAEKSLDYLKILVYKTKNQLLKELSTYYPLILQRDFTGMKTIDVKNNLSLNYGLYSLQNKDWQGATDHFSAVIDSNATHLGARIGRLIAFIMQGKKGNSFEDSATLQSRYFNDPQLLRLQLMLYPRCEEQRVKIILRLISLVGDKESKEFAMLKTEELIR